MKKITLVLALVAIVTVSFFFWLNASPALSAPMQTNPALAKGWTKTWGGASSTAQAKSVAIDSAGNVYVAGEFLGTVNFDPTGLNASAVVTSNNGTTDAYLTKFDSAGNFGWVRTWGGAPSAAPILGCGDGRDAANGVALDAAGNIYVAGLYQYTADFGSGLVSTSNVTNLSMCGNGRSGNNIFVAKFSPGGVTQWVRTWGGTSGGEGYSIAVDKTRGYVYVEGDYSTGAADHKVDFDPITLVNPSGAHDWHTNNGMFDAFLSAFDLNGNFVRAKTWGGEGYDDGPGVAVDGSGNVYVAGMYGSQTINFDPAGGVGGTGHPAHDSSYTLVDVFLSKFDVNGNFVWVRTWGGQGVTDAGEMVAVDSANNIYITGRFICTTCDFNPAGGTIHPSNGNFDAFVVKYDSAGNFAWARTWGALAWDAAGGLAVDSSNNVYVTGVYSTTVNFDQAGAGESHSSHGLWDASVTKFDANGNFQWAKTWGGTGNDGGLEVAVDGADNLYVVGFFSSPSAVNFDPGSGTDYHMAKGSVDAFLTKFLAHSVYLPLTQR